MKPTAGGFASVVGGILVNLFIGGNMSKKKQDQDSSIQKLLLVLGTTRLLLEVFRLICGF